MKTYKEILESKEVTKSHPLVKKLVKFAKSKKWKIFYGNNHTEHEEGLEDIVSAYEKKDMRFSVFNDNDEVMFFFDFGNSSGDDPFEKKVIDDYIAEY